MTTTHDTLSPVDINPDQLAMLLREVAHRIDCYRQPFPIADTITAVIDDHALPNPQGLHRAATAAIDAVPATRRRIDLSPDAARIRWAELVNYAADRLLT